MPDITRYDCHHNTLRLPTTLGSFSEIGKKLSPLEVAEVVLMLVGLFLEADVLICFHAVSVFYEKDEPLDSVPNKEGQEEQLPLLCRVDELVVELLFVEWPDGKDEAKKTDGKEIFAHRVSLD